MKKELWDLFFDIGLPILVATPTTIIINKYFNLIESPFTIFALSTTIVTISQILKYIFWRYKKY